MRTGIVASSPFLEISSLGLAMGTTNLPWCHLRVCAVREKLTVPSSSARRPFKNRTQHCLITDPMILSIMCVVPQGVSCWLHIWRTVPSRFDVSPRGILGDVTIPRVPIEAFHRNHEIPCRLFPLANPLKE